MVNWPGQTHLDASDLDAGMRVPIIPTSPTVADTSLGDLAQFFNAAADNIINTAIATVGAGTLTAAGLLGGLITRSGSTAAYTDTTATAAQINTAAGADTPAGTSQLVYIKNTVPFAQTIGAGAGVTLSPTTPIIPPNSMGVFLLTRTSATAYVLLMLAAVPLTLSALLASTALSTVGAGTITAAGIAGGVTNRTGSTAAFTDTTATAALIIAARPNANIGESWEYTYYNNTLGAATIAGGVGVTVSLVTVVPATMWARYLVTYTAAATITMVGIAMGPCTALPYSKYTTGTAATFAAGDITGAATVNYENTGNNATLTVRTAAQMFGDIPNCKIGHSYQLLIRNSHATGATITADGGATVTLTGTMTIAQNVTRTFNVVFPSATTCTITSMGISDAAA